jgi:hypothetical protein
MLVLERGEPVLASTQDPAVGRVHLPSAIQRGGRVVPNGARRNGPHGIALPPANACAHRGARCTAGGMRPNRNLRHAGSGLLDFPSRTFLLGLAPLVVVPSDRPVI